MVVLSHLKRPKGEKDTTEPVEVKKCGICGKLGHLEIRCWYREEHRDSKDTRNDGKEEQVNNSGNHKTMASSTITYSMVSSESCDRKDIRMGEFKSKNPRNSSNRSERYDRKKHMERNCKETGNLGHPKRPPTNQARSQGRGGGSSDPSKMAKSNVIAR